MANAFEICELLLWEWVPLDMNTFGHVKYHNNNKLITLCVLVSTECHFLHTSILPPPPPLFVFGKCDQSNQINQVSLNSYYFALY